MFMVFAHMKLCNLVKHYNVFRHTCRCLCRTGHRISQTLIYLSTRRHCKILCHVLHTLLFCIHHLRAQAMHAPLQIFLISPLLVPINSSAPPLCVLGDSCLLQPLVHLVCELHIAFLLFACFPLCVSVALRLSIFPIPIEHLSVRISPVHICSLCTHLKLHPSFHLVLNIMPKFIFSG